jgi:hypothetical protein
MYEEREFRSHARPGNHALISGLQVVEGASPAALSGKANAALDRIEIPQDTVEHISELLTAGSSLIISDYGISSETGPDTNFVVLTH